LGVREGTAVPVGEAVALAVGDAVAVGVTEAKIVAVHAAAGLTVGGSLDGCSTLVSPGLGEMIEWAGAVQPPTRITISSQPISRELIYSGILRAATSSTDFLRRPTIAARIARGILCVKTYLLMIRQVLMLVLTSVITKR
jgi:hypothetical protein